MRGLHTPRGARSSERAAALVLVSPQCGHRAKTPGAHAGAPALLTPLPRLLAGAFPPRATAARAGFHTRAPHGGGSGSGCERRARVLAAGARRTGLPAPRAGAGGDSKTADGSAMASNAERTQDMYEEYGFAAAGVKEVDAATLDLWMKDAPAGSLAVVDGRLPAEREVSMIPGAVAKEEFESGAAGAEATKVVAYCTIGKRSGDYVKSLAKSRPELECYNLKGSVLAWTHAGLPLVAGDGSDAPTRKVHCFGDKWNIPGAGYEGIVFEKTPWGKLIKDKASAMLPKWMRGGGGK